MDEYTFKTRDWLDQRFRETDAAGIYRAYQPIYGFRKGPCEFGQVARYIRTYHIMRALSRLNVRLLIRMWARQRVTRPRLPANCSGWRLHASIFRAKLAIAPRKFMGSAPYRVTCTNCRLRTGNSMSCFAAKRSEHVTDYRRATAELLRVAAKAVIITIPHEPEEKIDANVAAGEPHAHIHSFDLGNLITSIRGNCDQEF